MNMLGRDFYMRDTVTVAVELLGKQIVHETQDHILIGKIVETEAYNGPEDKACHAYGEKRTPRTEAMYYIGGSAYIFIIYGMYPCFNVVTGQKDIPSAVLVRAIAPIEGIDRMAELRYGMAPHSLTPGQRLNLCNGPGKLCISMGIGKEHNGIDLCSNSLYICDAHNEPFSIGSSPRVNIDYAEEYKDKPWRFFVEGNKHVSRP